MTEDADSIRKRAEEGDADAMNEMGVLYHNGRGVEQDFKEALSWYNKAIEKNSIDAWVNAGILYDFGQGVDTNHNHATSLFIMAAELGNEWAKKNIIFYPKGESTPIDFKEVIAWFKGAADRGDSDAMYYIGLLYERREDKEWNSEDAVLWYRKAADLGNADAMYRLGVLSYNGHVGPGRERDCRHEEATLWFTKAADLGNTDAMYRLGAIHEGAFEKGYEEAMSWYRKAADLGNTDAMNGVAALIPRMNGTAQWNEKAAVRWTKKSGVINERGSPVRSTASSFFDYGQRSEQSYKEAISWLNKAAELGNAWAMINISALYFNGLGVEKDYKEASSWGKKAMDLGNLYSIGSEIGYCLKDYRKVELSNDWETIIWMGLIEFDIQGTEESYKEAMSRFRKAADLGSTSAMNHIGILYEGGHGVEKNYSEALSWYKKAAEHGNIWAMMNISLFYFNGLGVEKDYIEAMSWYRKALYSGA